MNHRGNVVDWLEDLKKGKDDKDIEHEGTVYDAGAF